MHKVGVETLGNADGEMNDEHTGNAEYARLD